MDNTHKSSSHAVLNIKRPIVIVTKYRRKTLTPELQDYLKDAFADCPTAWRCKRVEFGDEPDHVHLRFDIQPALDISVLINDLKTASARRTRNRFAEHLAVLYKKPLFWHRADFVGSVGGATVETVRATVDTGTRRARPQGGRQSKSEAQTARLTPACLVGFAYRFASEPVRLARGMRGHMFRMMR